MKSILLGFILFTLFTTQTQAFPLIPNKEVAQGHLCNRQDSDYGGDRYKEKIAYCNRNVSYELKSQLYALYKVPEKCRPSYTIDHIIPLSIGGDNSPENLWPEHKLVKQTRPLLEEQVFGQLRDGLITQKVAVETILRVKYTPVQPHMGNSACNH